MGRLLLLVAVALCTYFEVAEPAWSQKRVALVIGNGAYETVANLPNPPREFNVFSSRFQEILIKPSQLFEKMAADRQIAAPE